jgi:hypothetical protein
VKLAVTKAVRLAEKMVGW